MVCNIVCSFLNLIGQANQNQNTQTLQENVKYFCISDFYLKF